jgi:ribonucleoside-diphosphate reductase alpha chain
MMSTNGPELEKALEQLWNAAFDSNARWAETLGINISAAITCIKPSGTVSQLAGVSSGIHPWHSQQYLRGVRSMNPDPLTRLMKDYGISHAPDLMAEDTTTVFTFPISAPEGAITRDDLTAIEHLELWLTYRKHWTDHNPSITVSVAEHEWDEVREWVWDHWDDVVGISFLPKDEHSYKQAPYQPITREQYLAAKALQPTVIDWDELSFYEQKDSTTGSRELACTSGACEMV